MRDLELQRHRKNFGRVAVARCFSVQIEPKFICHCASIFHARAGSELFSRLDKKGKLGFTKKSFDLDPGKSKITESNIRSSLRK